MNPSPLYSVYSTLLYFDLFRYPLRIEEIVKYCHYQKLNRVEVADVLTILQKEEVVFQFDTYYSLRNQPELIHRREEGNQLALKKWEKAYKYSSLMMKFPFVRAVWISGSLSKDFMDKHSDIDYFIVTEPGRLWICRTLLTAFKKIFLLNSHEHFCINYFIDSDSLKMEDRNLFTATELLTLRPVSNEKLYQEFLLMNDWANTFLPGFHAFPYEAMYEAPKSNLQSISEKIINVFPVNFFEKLFLKISLKYWNKKLPNINDKVKKNQVMANSTVSKLHPQGYKSKVLSLYTDGIEKCPQIVVDSVIQAT